MSRQINMKSLNVPDFPLIDTNIKTNEAREKTKQGKGDNGQVVPVFKRNYWTSVHKARLTNERKYCFETYRAIKS